jgi:hypothetical protein
VALIAGVLLTLNILKQKKNKGLDKNKGKKKK